MIKFIKIYIYFKIYYLIKAYQKLLRYCLIDFTSVGVSKGSLAASI